MKIPQIKHYPKRLYCGGECYPVRFVKGLKSHGETDPSKREIRIRAGMSRNETFRTFIHECLHLVEFEHPVPIPHKIVYAMEEGIFAFLLDNFVEFD